MQLIKHRGKNTLNFVPLSNLCRLIYSWGFRKGLTLSYYTHEVTKMSKR